MTEFNLDARINRILSDGHMRDTIVSKVINYDGKDVYDRGTFIADSPNPVAKGPRIVEYKAPPALDPTPPTPANNVTSSDPPSIENSNLQHSSKNSGRPNSAGKTHSRSNSSAGTSNIEMKDGQSNHSLQSPPSPLTIIKTMTDPLTPLLSPFPISSHYDDNRTSNGGPVENNSKNNHKKEKDDELSKEDHSNHFTTKATEIHSEPPIIIKAPTTHIEMDDSFTCERVHPTKKSSRTT